MADVTRVIWRKPVAMLAAVVPGPVRRGLLRVLLGYHIERDVSIGFGTVVLAADVTLKSGVSIGSFSRIKAHRIRFDSAVRIGKGVRMTVHLAHLHARSIIGDRVSVVGNADDTSSVLVLGMHSWIFQECYVDATKQVELGKNVGIGGRSEVFTHGYWLSALEGYPVAKKRVSFGNDVWIPWSCFIMPGARIGSGVVIGARSVVSGEIPDGVLAAGTPAKVLRAQARTPLSMIEQIELLRIITNDLASAVNGRFEERARGRWTEYLIDGSAYLRVHVSDCQAEFSSECLNIVWQPQLRYVPDHHLQWLCLDNSLSSPYRNFRPTARTWLEHARAWGIRFYPEDEYSEYSY